MKTVNSIDELEEIYGVPSEAAVIKVASRITPEYQPFIEASPFLTLATHGSRGADCSPRGDAPGFVRIADEKTLHLPDRRGNNRVDSLRNIIENSLVGLLFFIPGCRLTLRVNGKAAICIEPDLLATFSRDGKLPRSVLVITVDEIFFQCARAIIRSNLWNSDTFKEDSSLPSAGQILAGLSDNQVGGTAYDQELPERMRKTLW